MAAMWPVGILFALCIKMFGVENVMIPLKYPAPDIEDPITLAEEYEKDIYDNPFRVMGMNDIKQTTTGYDYGLLHKEKRINKNTKKPCSVMVVSNGHNPGMQSLLRKYRYDGNGVLIPSSVKYYIKLPQSYGLEPILIPLTGRAISPLGGYVRYYKEVPPIRPSV